MVLDETETPLVLVRPGDGAATVLERVRATGAARVQLLVPDGVTALQRPEEAARLHADAAAAGIALLLISSDLETLAAAQAGNIPTLGVRDARVVAPPRFTPVRPIGQDSTRVLDEAPTPAGGRATEGDAAFLAGLDELDAPTPASTRAAEDEAAAAAAGLAVALSEPATPTLADPAQAEAEAAAAAASIAAALSEPEPFARPAPASRPTMTDDELLLATLAGEPGLTPPRVARPAPDAADRATPPPAEAFDAAGAAAPPDPQAGFQLPRASNVKAAPAPGQRRGATPSAGARGRPAARTPTGSARAPAARRGAPWLIIGLTVALLALLLAIGGALLLGGRVTVAVSPPVRPDTIEPITSLPVPIVAPGSGATTAVEAESVRSEVAFSVEGEVLEGTLTPSGSAGGTLTIFNSTAQAVSLPAGTEFIAVNGAGQEVPFVSTGDVLVPGATTSDTGAQIITSRGQANVTVTARSPGSGSNVDGNTVRRVAPPGSPGFNLGGGGFIIQHPPLQGGSEEEVRIVKDSNVQALLAPALEGLDAEARRQLDGLAQARGLALDQTTIRPRRADLEQLQGFDYTVQPAVGQTLDPANPRFTLTVQATYSGLGVPADNPLDRQLGPVLTEQLLQAGRISAGDCRAPAVTDWRWDGESLLVDGQIAPDTQSPGCQGGLEPGTLERVREAVRGKTRAEAQAALDALVAEGLIGGYILPDVPRLPAWDWQLTVTG